MNEIRDIIGAFYRGDLEQQDAQAKLAALGVDSLAEFILDAFNRGWVSRFNLGLNEEGEPI